MAEIRPPFKAIIGTDGTPLDSGFIYIGAYGSNPETSPITVYWDAALTQPAPQPLRTVNGYLSRNGTPARVFASSIDYSMTVRDRNSALVFSDLTFSSLAAFQSDMAAAIHGAPADATPSTADEFGVWDSVTGLLRKMTFTFLQSGAGAILLTIRRALQLSIWAEHFGADPAATAAVNDAAFAAAIAEAVARGGSEVNFGEGTFMTSVPIVLYSGVFLRGRGSYSSRIKLANSSDCNILETLNFAALTGTNSWLVSEGVPVGFGFDALTFDGNRANQVVAGGVAIYGKGYHVGFDVKIVNTKGIGFYSECAATGGQVVEQDMPEGNIGKVQTYMTGQEGFVYRGPHDQPIHDVSVSQAGQDGVYDGVAFEAKNGVYLGSTYITGSVHAYACTGRGVSFRCSMNGANQVIGENNDRDGVVLEAPGETAGMPGCLLTHINYIEAYGNDNHDTGLYWAVRVSGSSNTISSSRISSAGQAAGCLFIEGNINQVANAHILGANAVADGTGLKVKGAYHQITASVSNIDSGAAVGLETAGTAYCQVNVMLFNCAVTSWLNSGVSIGDNFKITSFAAAGAPFTQTGTFSETNIYDVIMQHGAATVFSDYGGQTSAILAGNTSQTVTHLGFITPDASDIHLTQIGDWGTNRMWVANITATTFDVVTDVAAGGLLPFGWKLHI